MSALGRDRVIFDENRGMSLSRSYRRECAGNHREYCSATRAYDLLYAGNKRIFRPLARCLRGALTGRPMKRIDERELREELVKLRAEHRELDDQIILLEDTTSADQLLVKRLKKKKLAIKDRMTAIEDQLLPDIIA